MRTLNRPMFRMGGPIKEGVMHGIREPHNRGGRIGLNIGGAISAARWLATLGSRGKQSANVFSNVGKTISGLGSTIGGVGSKISAATPPWLKSWIGRDPTAKGLGWGYKTLTGPTAKTWAGKALQGVTTPTGLLTAGYIGSRFLPDGTPKEGPPTGIEKPGGYPKAPGTGKGKELTDQQRKDFANAQRNERVEKYLQMMGYDQSKKTAIADAPVSYTHLTLPTKA